MSAGKRDYRGEYSGGPGMPRGGSASRDALQMRREGRAEVAGLTGAYVDPSRRAEIATPAEDDFEQDRVAAEREALLARLNSIEEF